MSHAPQPDHESINTVQGRGWWSRLKFDDSPDKNCTLTTHQEEKTKRKIVSISFLLHPHPSVSFSLPTFSYMVVVIPSFLSLTQSWDVGCVWDETSIQRGGGGKDDSTWREKRDGEWMRRLLMASGGAVKFPSLLCTFRLSHRLSPTRIRSNTDERYWRLDTREEQLNEMSRESERRKNGNESATLILFVHPDTHDVIYTYPPPLQSYSSLYCFVVSFIHFSVMSLSLCIDSVDILNHPQKWKVAAHKMNLKWYFLARLSDICSVWRKLNLRHSSAIQRKSACLHGRKIFLQRSERKKLHKSWNWSDRNSFTLESKWFRGRFISILRRFSFRSYR